MSEAIGAMLAGFEEIVAIEMSEEYCEIGESRMRWWEAKMRETGLSDPQEILKVHGKRKKPAPTQLSLGILYEGDNNGNE